jgi:hypothetical protein
MYIFMKLAEFGVLSVDKIDTYQPRIEQIQPEIPSTIGEMSKVELKRTIESMAWEILKLKQKVGGYESKDCDPQNIQFNLGSFKHLLTENSQLREGKIQDKEKILNLLEEIGDLRSRMLIDSDSSSPLKVSA